MADLHDIPRFIVTEFAPDVPADELDPDFDLLDNGVVDSLALLVLIEWVGEHYDLPVGDLDLTPDSFRSVHAIQQFVTTARAGAA
jgi:acyl carrier protein